MLYSCIEDEGRPQDRLSGAGLKPARAAAVKSRGGERRVEVALADRPAPASLIHHSDRGVQYCAAAYFDLLRSYGIRISMSRSGNHYDNALAESFMRTLKCEEVYLKTYRDLDDAALHIQDFLERIYNCKGLHSSLGYSIPDGVRGSYLRQLCGGAGLSFLKA